MLYKAKDRVLIEDTDAFGRLNWRVYSRYCERGEDGYLRKLGYDVNVLKNKYNICFPRRDAHFEYLAPVYVGETIEIRTRVEKVGKTSLIWNHRFFKGGKTVAKARVVVVAVDIETGKKVPIPNDIKKVLASSIEKV
jgi:acyl-CoA thioester hydrolase